jgi:hypothetical protein
MNRVVEKVHEQKDITPAQWTSGYPAETPFRRPRHIGIATNDRWDVDSVTMMMAVPYHRAEMVMHG